MRLFASGCAPFNKIIWQHWITYINDISPARTQSSQSLQWPFWVWNFKFQVQTFVCKTKCFEGNQYVSFLQTFVKYYVVFKRSDFYVDLLWHTSVFVIYVLYLRVTRVSIGFWCSLRKRYWICLLIRSKQSTAPKFGARSKTFKQMSICSSLFFGQNVIFCVVLCDSSLAKYRVYIFAYYVRV